MGRTCVLVLSVLAYAVPAGAAPNAFDPGAGTDASTAKAAPARAATRLTGKAAAKLDSVIQAYVDLHGEHLKSRQWITRAMATISLSRVDDPRVVAKLLEVARGDANVVVRVFAWECLHAHNPRLTDEQRRQWLATGLQLDKSGAIRGDLRATLLHLAAANGPTRAGQALFRKLFTKTNLTQGADRETLLAMREALARWQDPTLAKQLILATRKLDDAYRAEFLLSGLTTDVKLETNEWKLASGALWQLVQERYATWLKDSPPKPAREHLPVYKGASHLVGKPVQITDASDPKWRGQLELPEFQLDQIDVMFVMDSTGSMEQAIRWLRGEVMRMMRACGMISRRPRIGVVFYRDHGDEYVVKPLSLTANGATLLKAIDQEHAAGGGDIPEAVYEGLVAAIRKQEWSSGPKTYKAVVLIGDAPPHEDSLGKTKELMAEALAKRFHIYCVKATTAYGSRDMSSFDRIAEWSKGQSTSAGFGYDGALMPNTATRAIPCVWRGPMTGYAAATKRTDDLAHRIVAQILDDSAPKIYHDRVGSFVNVLMEYVTMPFPEKHRPFGPHKVRNTGGTGGGKRKPSQPYDPQRR